MGEVAAQTDLRTPSRSWIATRSADCWDGAPGRQPSHGLVEIKRT